MNTSKPPPLRSNLGNELQSVARHLRATRLHRRGFRRWLVVAVLSFVLLEVRANVPKSAPYALAMMGLLLLAAIVRSIIVSRRDKLNYREAAHVVETQFPDLKQALRTAAEQEPGKDGQFSFLQLRVINEALRHAGVNDWRKKSQKRAELLFAGHAAALAIALALILGPVLLLLAHQEIPMPKITRAGFVVTVTPGSKDVERGSTVFVAARFDERLPHQVELIWSSADGKSSGRVAMARSLSDPIYAFTLPTLNSNVTYSVAYDSATTANYTLKVFDQPALKKADATLDYPTYTGLSKKVIQDTRRVSAITGTKLEYDFTMNKPMQEATLQDDQGKKIALTPSNADHTQFTTSLTIDHTEHLTLHLVDSDGRTNPAPTNFNIEALENKRPVVAVTFPQRDTRVSPIEEIHIQANAKNQFGLLDYGIGYSIGGSDPQYISLNKPETKSPVQATFSQVLDLEAKGVQPGDVVSWFAWADDNGPDGKTRRTNSNLTFAEVRPFETIFHEDDNAANQQQQQQQPQQQQQQSGGQNQQLAELERQISLAIWNLKQEDKPDKSFTDDVATLKESQDQAITQLATAAENAQTAQQQQIAEDASKLMKQADDNLAAAGTKNALAPLDPAWSGAQGAYQDLLRMQDRQFRVAQQRGGQQGQQQQNQRMQDQLNQLRFRQQQDRYQNQNTAQDPTTPQQQRDELQAQSRLSELARQQQDLNQRLQELQTALTAAQTQDQRDELQRELKRLEDEQRNMLAAADDAGQQVDRLQAGQQSQQARQQLDQARENMRQSSDQLAQNQVSQALASGTKANQALQQSEDTLRKDNSSRFADQMDAARQAARDLANTQQQDGKQLDQLAKDAGKSLDDSQERQALAQSFTQQRDNLNNLLDQLKQITDDSEDTDPNLHKQLYEMLRANGNTTAATADDLKNGANYLRNGFVDQTRPLQNQAAQNLDQLRQGVEHAADSVLGDNTAAKRFAQNELNDLTQQLMREQPATSEQFRTDTAQPGTPGQNGQPNAANQNGTQPGQNGQGQNQIAQDNTGNAFRQGQTGNGQPGQQPGQNGQQPGAGRQGTQQGNGQQGTQPGQGQPQPGDQFAQNAGGDQAGQNGQQPGQGRQGGQPGNGRQGGQPGQGQPGDQVAQGGGNQPGQNGQQPGQGRQGGQRGQGQQPGNGNGQPGGDQVAQNGGNQPAQGNQPGNGRQGRGQAGGQRGQGQPGNGNAQGGDQLAQNGNGQNQPDEPALAGNQPGGNQPGRGRQGGARQGGNPQGGTNGGNGGAYADNYNGGGYSNLGADQVGLQPDLTNTGGRAGPPQTGPITGTDFATWADRLRTVENLIDDPQLREQVASARAQAEDMRRAYQQHSNPPQWDMVLSNVVNPLNKVRNELRQEVARHDQPDALQPVDQDPVPDKYADSVKSYYEALGN